MECEKSEVGGQRTAGSWELATGTRQQGKLGTRHLVDFGFRIADCGFNKTKFKGADVGCAICDQSFNIFPEILHPTSQISHLISNVDLFKRLERFQRLERVDQRTADHYLRTIVEVNESRTENNSVRKKSVGSKSNCAKMR